MGGDSFNQLSADGIKGVQTGQRVLEYCADSLAAYATHLVKGQVVDAFPIKPGCTPGDIARRLKESDNGIARQRFAGARLTDYSENLSRLFLLFVVNILKFCVHDFFFITFWGFLRARPSILASCGSSTRLLLSSGTLINMFRKFMRFCSQTLDRGLNFRCLVA